VHVELVFLTHLQTMKNHEIRRIELFDLFPFPYLVSMSLRLSHSFSHKIERELFPSVCRAQAPAKSCHMITYKAIHMSKAEKTSSQVPTTALEPLR
jgi:hypothetical protein